LGARPVARKNENFIRILKNEVFYFFCSFLFKLINFLVLFSFKLFLKFYFLRAMRIKKFTILE